MTEIVEQKIVSRLQKSFFLREAGIKVPEKAPSQAASAISCMVSRILTPPGRHHSGVSLLIRRFAQKAIATAMFQCKPLFLFILGPIVLGPIRNPIWQDSGGLASSFNFQQIMKAYHSL